MQASLAYYSISPAPVSQRPAQLAASFQSSIHGTDDPANVALWIRAGLVVAVRAPRNVTQPSWQQREAGWEACMTSQARA